LSCYKWRAVENMGEDTCRLYLMAYTPIGCNCGFVVDGRNILDMCFDWDKSVFKIPLFYIYTERKNESISFNIKT
jgi:hypothetical protein